MDKLDYFANYLAYEQLEQSIVLSLVKGNYGIFIGSMLVHLFFFSYDISYANAIKNLLCSMVFICPNISREVCVAIYFMNNFYKGPFM